MREDYAPMTTSTRTRFCAPQNVKMLLPWQISKRGLTNEIFSATITALYNIVILREVIV